MANHYGGQVVLTATLTPLSDSSVGFSFLTIRNGTSNSTMYFGNESGTLTGFLVAGEAFTFHNMRPKDIWVMGTAGNGIYWHGNG